MRVARKIIVVLLVLMFATSCAVFQAAKDNPYGTWSAKKKLTNAINIYILEYDKYVRASELPNLTPEQRAYLYNKRIVLVGLDNVIEMLIPIVDGGGVIGPELEAQLVHYITLLGFQPM